MIAAPSTVSTETATNKLSVAAPYMLPTDSADKKGGSCAICTLPTEAVTKNNAVAAPYMMFTEMLPKELW